MSDGFHPPVEEYLEAIHSLDEEGSQVIQARLAERLGHSAPSVSETVRRLQADGYVLITNRTIVLTPEGRTRAESVVRKHRLAERLLTDVIGLEWEKVHREADRWEHAISADVEEKLVALLGDPATCPHGNPMPGVEPIPTRPLDRLAKGERATVERIPDQFEHEAGFLEYLDTQGVRPGVTLEMVEQNPGLLRVGIDGTVRTLRPDCGQKVWMAL